MTHSKNERNLSILHFKAIGFMETTFTLLCLLMLNSCDSVRTPSLNCFSSQHRQLLTKEIEMFEKHILELYETTNLIEGYTQFLKAASENNIPPLTIRSVYLQSHENLDLLDNLIAKEEKPKAGICFHYVNPQSKSFQCLKAQAQFGEVFYETWESTPFISPVLLAEELLQKTRRDGLTVQVRLLTTILFHSIPSLDKELQHTQHSN